LNRSGSTAFEAAGNCSHQPGLAGRKAGRFLFFALPKAITFCSDRAEFYSNK
jgi:hypothetical protein